MAFLNLRAPESGCSAAEVALFPGSVAAEGGVAMRDLQMSVVESSEILSKPDEFRCVFLVDWQLYCVGLLLYTSDASDEYGGRDLWGGC